MRERDNNFYMDFEDTGFGGSAMEQNEALANMIQPPAPAKTDYTQALKQQILNQNLTSKWTGEGYGGAEANAKAMAKLLADAGITDIKQFGKVDKYEPVEITGYTLNGKGIQRPNDNTYYEMVYEGESENGPEYRRRDLTPQEVAQVKPNYGHVVSWGDAENPAEIIPIDASKVVERDGKLVGVTGQTFGNKETGQEINSGSGRWAWQGGEDLFGGTGEGKGNTAFRVQLGPDGTPYFYTTHGSSSDLGSIAPLLAIASFIPGVAPFAQGLNALIAAKEGNVLGAIAGAAGLGGYTDVANAARLGSALQSGDPLSIALAGANVGGVTNVGGIDLKDISKGVGAIKAIESGDPTAILRAASGYMGGSSDGPKSEDFIQGYFQPGGEGYIAPAEEQAASEPVVAPVSEPITVEQEPANVEEFIKSLEQYVAPEPIAMPSPDEDFVPTLPTPEPAPAPEPITVKQEPANVDELITQLEQYKAPEPEPTIPDYIAPVDEVVNIPDYIAPVDAEEVPELVMTGERPSAPNPEFESVFDPTFGGELPLPELPTTPTTPATAPKVPTPTKTPIKTPTTPAPTASAASSGMDLAGLMALLGGQQQPVQQAPMQDPYAHIKLMEDLFGSNIDLTPAGDNTAQRK